MGSIFEDSVKNYNDKEIRFHFEQCWINNIQLKKEIKN